jgi:hypothetical protein
VLWLQLVCESREPEARLIEGDLQWFSFVQLL